MAFLSILSGARTLVELNKQLRSEPMVYNAFGLDGCAEQSVVQQTLDHCTATTVTQTEAALTEIYRQFSRGYHHNYTQKLQLLDLDFTGLPCGPKAALATKGYFAHKRNRRGRQLGRVLATHYGEVVVDQLYTGNVQLNAALSELVEKAEGVLGLNRAKRERTLLRVDSGGGTLDNINWVLERGYLYLGKDYSGQRASTLSQSVEEWVADPLHSGREVGWVGATHPYKGDVRRIAVRCQKANGQWAVGLLVTNLSDPQLEELNGPQPTSRRAQHRGANSSLLGLVYLYDQRGGGVEAEIKADKTALGLGARNKKSFAGQQMVVLLGMLAHNVVAWSRYMMGLEQTQMEGPAKSQSGPARMGLCRIVRDVLRMNGLIWLDATGQISHLALNSFDPLAKSWLGAFSQLLLDTQVGITLGQT
jgi:hypothetical protein